jgi:AraC family transcriptional regulator of arabinose operon
MHFQPRSHWQPWLVWPSETPGFAALSDIPETGWQRILAAGDRCRGAAFAGQMGRLAFGEELALAAAEEIILILKAIVTQRHSRRPLDPRVAHALDIIADMPQRTLTVGELAASVNLSASRFAHLFRRQTGQSVQRYIEAVRLRYARDLLELGGLNVSEAAGACGFADPFYFSTRFKKLFGVAPSTYTKARRG